MFRTKIFLLLTISIISTPMFLFAQNISGVINAYAKVTSISGNQFTIGTPGGKNGASLNDYNVGMRVMIYQAKGISISTSSGAAYGGPINYNNSGRYELATVTSRSGNVITLTTPTNSYDVSGMVQLVSVPQYIDVFNNNDLIATPWNKTVGYGGIIALEANRLTLGGHIRVDGVGFEGGAGSSNNGGGCASIYTSTSTSYGAKGESNSTNTQYQRGMSAIGLGGGGGSTHNGGGGGGSNHGYGDDGGRGWRCNLSNNAGGRGGHAYAYNPENQRLFFGGGGGGGQVNNSYNAKGGNGGGIVFLHLNTLRSGNLTYEISANGGTPPYTVGNDGAGGGGAGGIIYVSAKNYELQSGQIVLEADGADGGNVNSGAAHGGGGGGGSGIIIMAVQPPFGVNYSAENGNAGMDSYSASPSGNVGYDPPLSQDLLILADNFVPAMKGPGGHVSGLSGWFIARSDNLFTGSSLNGSVSDGSGIQSWKNLAISSNYIQSTGGNTSASFENDAASLVNYNPVVRMSNVNRKLRSISDITAQTLIVVTKPTSLYNLRGLVGFDGDKGIRARGNNSWAGDNNSDDWSSGGSSHINGVSTKTHDNNWHIVTQKRGGIHTDQFFVGGYYNNRTYSGDIAEIIIYNDGLSSTEQKKVESYLAIKYGITLSSIDYLASDATIIWDRSENTNYNNDIAAIGRDDNSLLNQVKSKSINSSAVLTIANGTNFSSPSSISSDMKFMFWAHNGNPNTAKTGDYFGLTDNGSARIWKITEEGSIGTVRMQIPKSSLPSDVSMLLVSTNESFPNSGATSTANLVSSGDNWEVSYNFSNGQYFTFGRNNTAPVLSNLESSILSHCDNSSTLTSAITLADTDNDQVTATVSIGTGYVAAEDSLVYSTVAGVSVNSHTKQQIQLSSATLANMQTALRAVQYFNKDSGTDRTTGSRTINFTINDGWANSNQLSRNIQVYSNPSPVGIYHND